MSGVFASVAMKAGQIVSDFLTRPLTHGSSSASPDHLGCDDVDPTQYATLRKVELTPRPSTMGCDWVVTTEDGRTVLALRLREYSGAGEKLNPMLKRSREAGFADLHVGPSLEGDAALLYVGAGDHLSRAKKAPRATRSLMAQVSYEALGLSAATGKRLAVAIATEASNRHEPLATPSTSQSASG